MQLCVVTHVIFELFPKIKVKCTKLKIQNDNEICKSVFTWKISICLASKHHFLEKNSKSEPSASDAISITYLRSCKHCKC